MCAVHAAMMSTLATAASVEEKERRSTRVAASALQADSWVFLSLSCTNARPRIGYAPPPHVDIAGALQYIGGVWRALWLFRDAHTLTANGDCCEVERIRAGMLRAAARVIARTPHDLHVRSVGGTPTYVCSCRVIKIASMCARSSSRPRLCPDVRSGGDHTLGIPSRTYVFN